jgi:hypothetical protein
MIRIQEVILCTEEGKAVVLILIKQAIPCIMHLDNHRGEKNVTIVIHIGTARYQRGQRSSSLDGYIE